MRDSDDSHVDDPGSVPTPSAGAGQDETPPSGRRGATDRVGTREGQGRDGKKPKPRKPSSKSRRPKRRPSRRSRGRPTFLGAFPDDPELSQVVEAFEQGDYATVRQRAGQLAKHADSKRVRQAARELLHRIEPDPLAKLLLAAAFALLLFLVIWTYAGH